ncbi:MAG: DNA cytosine methyltransferase [Nitrospirae bacterium]|nr:DNA cytosine methyltransferase [Nitrospirota bacterium]
MKDKPIAVDLFCGAGGLSEGLQKASFSVVAAVENDKNAATTYKKNHPNTVLICKDISDLTSTELLGAAGVNSSEIDVIAGGPPCQGFSMANGHSRHIDNSNNGFVWHFVKWVEQIRPKAFLMENVIGFTAIDGGKLRDELLNKFRELGYIYADIFTLDAANYGVPQHRKRVFLVGFLNKNKFEIPKEKFGFNGSPFQTVADAIIGDLPFINPLPGDNKTSYAEAPTSWYQHMIRGNRKTLHNHITTNCAEHIREKFSWIPQGANWEHIKDRIGIKVQYSSLYRRLDPNKPSITMSNYRKSMIIHPLENRLLSVREAARFQSFSDSYIFEGGISSMQQQVGNAVPPLLANAVGKQIKNML